MTEPDDQPRWMLALVLGLVVGAAAAWMATS
jgi:hypothetical protein